MDVSGTFSGFLAAYFSHKWDD
ncbi:protein MgtS [Escherichia coli]